MARCRVKATALRLSPTLKRISWLPGRFGGRAYGFAHGLEGGHHPGVGAREVEVHEDALEVEGRASEVAKRRGQRRAAGTPWSGNA